ncbi:MAG: hypothetical protein JXA49_08030 [Actinobacteria bacterium]|nr:hypothetical protein [Actinomycetota bacterium]
MEKNRSVSAGVNEREWWKDPKISTVLMAATYIIGGLGIGLGMYAYFDEGAVKGLHWALPLTVGAVGVLSFIRHSMFCESDASRMGIAGGDPYFQMEVGYANGGMGLIALIAFFSNWGTAADISLMLAFAVYLSMGLILASAKKIKSRKLSPAFVIRNGLWALEVGFMFFFGISAAIAAGL